MATVIELKPFGEFWQVTHDGSVLACAVDRRGAINVAATLLRRQLEDATAVVDMTFVGLELSELLEAESMDQHWNRKGPCMELDLFSQAEAYLEMEIVSAEMSALVSQYRELLDAEDFDEALELLMLLGEWQACSNRYWKVLEQLAASVWPTEYMWIGGRRGNSKRRSPPFSGARGDTSDVESSSRKLRANVVPSHSPNSV